jgi:hypothetical protein
MDVGEAGDERQEGDEDHAADELRGRRGPHVGRARGTVKERPTRYRFGNTSKTTNSTTNGRDGGRPASSPVVNHFVHGEVSTPMPSPPTSVSGRLVKAPIAAAPKAATTRSARKQTRPSPPSQSRPSTWRRDSLQVLLLRLDDLSSRV